MHRWFFPKYPLTTLLGPTYRSPMVFPTCSPTPSVTSTPTPTKVKCTFCYRDNTNYIMSFGHSFCDDYCNNWWKEEEQKRMRQEYLELQGMSYLLRWPHRGWWSFCWLFTYPPHPTQTVVLEVKNRGVPTGGCPHFYFWTGGLDTPPPRAELRTQHCENSIGVSYIRFALTLPCFHICAYTMGVLVA